MGLYDTPGGIRFRQALPAGEPLKSKASGGDSDDDSVPEGMEALIIAATDPQVRAAHEKRQSPVAGAPAETV